MDTASQQILLVLEHLVKSVPIGTNLALLQLMWAMLTGHFLPSRGAVHTALHLAGFKPSVVRRSWRALRYGVWSVDELLSRWQAWVAKETHWQPRTIAGWQAVAYDITTFWRPKLQKWQLRGFHQLAGRLLPGVVLGVVVRVGQIEGQRLPLLHKLLPAPVNTTDEEALKQRLLVHAKQTLGKAEVGIFDGGFKLKAVQAARVPRFVVRQANNCVFRRNFLPQKEHNRGRPTEYGSLVRPLARVYDGKQIEATPPDEIVTFVHEGLTVTAYHWTGLVRSDQKVDVTHQTVDVWVYYDPRFTTPLVVVTNLSLQASVPFQLYLDRWPVEQVPLAAKQMLGLHRMFVHAMVTVWRLPQLALLMGNVLTIMAAVLPPMPTGYWDRHPKKRVVACVGSCSGLIFLN